MSLIQTLNDIISATTVKDIHSVILSQNNYVQLRREYVERYVVPLYEDAGPHWKMKIITFIGEMFVYGSPYFRDNQFIVIGEEFMKSEFPVWESAGTFKITEGCNNGIEKIIPES